MSLSLGAPATAQLATGVAGVAWLIELDLDAPYGTHYLTTAPVDVVAGGHTYTGFGDNVAVAGLSESEDSAARQVTISFALANAELLGVVLGGVDHYRNRRARLYLQLFDAAFVPVASRVHRWSGRMEPVRVPRGGAGGAGRVELPCSRAGMPHARAFQGMRHTHAQQLARYPGNLVLQYLQDLIDKPALWLSTAFQRV